jgi:hypothetical protein
MMLIPLLTFGANIAFAQPTYCPDLGDFDIAWGIVSAEGNGWRVTGEGGVHGKTAWNLLGGSIEFDYDACGGVTGVNNNFYTISPQGGPASGYCDIQTNDSPICMELDITENNGQCLSQTTWHVWGNKDGGCDQNGCYGQTHISDCHFHMRTEFGADGSITQYYNGNSVNIDNGGSLGSAEKNQIVQNMQSTGAAIASTQWTGWVPDDGSCGGGGSSSGASFAVTNVKVQGTVLFGPEPAQCAPAPSPSPSPSPSGKCDVHSGKNNNGVNLMGTTASSADECCDKCSGASGCAGFTFVIGNGECWLKSSVDSLVDDEDVISGSFSAPPTPPPVPTPPTPPAPTPSPTPSPSPTPTGCPGGSLSACIAVCPTDPSAVFEICVQECETRCSAPTCRGGSLKACCAQCPAEHFTDCIDECGKDCPNSILV